MHGSNQWNVMLHSSTKMLSDIHHSGNSPIPFSSASGQAHTKTPFSFLGCRMRLRSGLILTPHRLCSQPLKNRTSLTNHLPKCWMVIIVIIFYATYLHPPFDPRKRWLGFCLIRFQPRVTDCSHVSLLALTMHKRLICLQLQYGYCVPPPPRQHQEQRVFHPRCWRQLPMLHRWISCSLRLDAS